MKKLISLLLCLVMMLTCITPAFAEGKDCSLTISYKTGDTAISGAEVSIYRAAELKDGKYALCGQFADDPVVIDMTSDSASAAAANALYGIAVAEKRTPDASLETDENGEAYFASLDEGLYLVSVGAVLMGEKYYGASDYFVALPGTNAETGESDKNIISMPKSDVSAIEGDTTEIYAIKRWADGSDTHSPINVTLYRDGESFETVELSSGNEWKHTWTGLDAAHEYVVSEDEVPKEYNVSITRENSTFTVTNTSDTAVIPVNPDKPDNNTNNIIPAVVVPAAVVGVVSVVTAASVIPVVVGGVIIGGVIVIAIPVIIAIYHYDVTHNNTDTPDTPDTTDKTDNSGKTDEKLPYTGVLWWPVPVMALAGLALIGAGVKLRKKKDEEAV